MRPPLHHAHDHARLLEHLEVLGDRGLGDPEAAGGLADGGRPSGQPLDDAAPDGGSERAEGIVHHVVNSRRRWGALSRRMPAARTNADTPLIKIAQRGYEG